MRVKALGLWMCARYSGSVQTINIKRLKPVSPMQFLKPVTQSSGRLNQFLTQHDPGNGPHN